MTTRGTVVQPRSGNPLVARKQRNYIDAVGAYQSGRPVLVQPLRTNPIIQAKTPWVPVTEVAPTEEVWTRGIALNELVFDLDTDDWREARTLADKIMAVMDFMGVKYQTALTGGKGIHIHTWIDLKSVKADASLFIRAKRLGVCPWSAVREAVADAVLDAADVPKGDARWSTGGGIVDRSKIRWSADRKGSMIREYGCRGKKGFRKTLVENIPEELGPMPLVIPDAPTPMWSLSHPGHQRVIRHLEAEVAAAEAARAAPPKAMDGVELCDIPCAWKTMHEGVGTGSRHVAHLNLVSTCYALGKTADEAAEAVRAAVKNHGLSEGDTVEKLVEQVYSGRWRVPANLSCPSPHTKGLCDPNGCALSRHLAFS